MKTIIVIAVSLVIFLLFFAVARKSKMPKALKFLFLLSPSYPIAKLLQVTVVGPSWIRWYLTDYGFVILFTIVLIPIVTGKKFNSITDFRKPLIQSGIFALCFAFFIELTQIYGKYYLANNNKKYLVSGDYNDFLMYLLGFLTVILIAYDSSLKVKQTKLSPKKK